MIVEFGPFGLVVGLLAACWLFGVRFFIKEPAAAFQLQKIVQWVVFASLACAYTLLTYAFMTDDYTVTYVAKHSNSLLPWYYKLTALWGGHEGSLLLWVLILSLWSTLYAYTAKQTPALKSTTLQVLACLQAVFILLLLTASTPFERAFPDIIIDGMDLNPLLQDFGFIIHPPMLYLGYVGLAIPFAIAIAALWHNEITADVLQTLRPWVLASWGVLSLGIALGSWWAYYELGWGGWWFWDPVENASFMPWLTATALLHALIAAHKHPTFMLWSLILAVLAFALSVLGTFLVRSGALSSVHAFASDPKRGLYLLIFLSVLLLVSGGLFFYRRAQWQQAQPIPLNSKAGLVFSGSVLLMVVVASICLGTLYPLLTENMFSRTLSIGPPYFNMIFIVLMLPVLLMLVLGTLWKKEAHHPLKAYGYTGAVALLATVGLLVWLSPHWNSSAFLGLSIGVWILLSIGVKVTSHWRARRTLRFASREKTMMIAHLGVAITLIGIVVVSAYELEKEIEITQGQSYAVGPYQAKVEKFEAVTGANFVGTQAVIEINQNNKLQKTLYPEKRAYFIQDTAMSETAIWPGFFKDIYVALGEPLSATSWSARVYYKPFVRWIWLGAICMLLASVAGLYRPRPRSN